LDSSRAAYRIFPLFAPLESLIDWWILKTGGVNSFAVYMQYVQHPLQVPITNVLDPSNVGWVSGYDVYIHSRRAMIITGWEGREEKSRRRGMERTNKHETYLRWLWTMMGTDEKGPVPLA
jgi:hypothetical protein